MKNLLCLLFSCLCFTAFSQVETDEKDLPVAGETGVTVPDSPIDSTTHKYILGVGFNIVDNTSTRNNQFFNWSEHFNVGPIISKISLEREWHTYLGTELALSYNKLRKEKFQNGEVTLTEDVNYVAVDVLGKFYLGEVLFDNEWLDINICLGLGVHTANKVFNQTLDFGAGFQFWPFRRFGFRLQTICKSAFDQKTLANNHIQHSAEVLYKF